MNSARPLLLRLAHAGIVALALGAGLPAARAQERPDAPTAVADERQRLSRLEAENAVLRLDVQALRERILALEALVRARPSTAGGGASAPAPRGGTADADALPRISADGKTIIVPGLDVARMGAATPEALARALASVLAGRDGGFSGPLAVATQLSAFGPVDLLFPEEMWTAAKPPGFPGTPTRPGLLSSLEPLTHYARAGELSFALLREDGASFVVEATVRQGESRVDRGHVTGVRVNGRCLVVHVRWDGSVVLVRDAIVHLGAGLSALAARGSSVTGVAELEAALQKADPASGSAPFGKAVDDHTRELHGYRIELRGAGASGHTVVAKPADPTNPTLILGPAPGAHASAASANVVREEGGWDPSAPRPGDVARDDAGTLTAPTQAELRAIAGMRALYSAQADFRYRTTAYARTIGDLLPYETLILIPGAPSHEEGIAKGYVCCVLAASVKGWSAVASPAEGDGTAAGGDARDRSRLRSFYIDQSGVIRWARGRMADASCPPIVGR